MAPFQSRMHTALQRSDLFLSILSVSYFTCNPSYCLFFAHARHRIDTKMSYNTLMSYDPTQKTVVFTDLDGTLLDHDTYSCVAASEMIQYLQEREIPLIIVTSKTATEVQKLQQSLGLHTPAIVENGAGIVDGTHLEPLGKDYATIRAAFERYAKEFDIKGFADMSAQEVAQHTALPLERAQDAKVRTFTEPFIMNDAHNLPRLKTLADADGLEIIRGGRFYHLITRGQDKAAAIMQVKARLEALDGPYVSIALGDGANDITMLQASDNAFLIPKSDGSYLDCEIDGLIKAPYPGPRGWNAVMKEYFRVS